MKKLTLFIIGIISFSIIIAQSPQGFKYQAVARDGLGQVIENQNVSLRISILAGSMSGPTIYQEEHSAVTNDFGLVNIEIGGGNVVSGDFTTINWGNNSYFVQVELDETGGTTYQMMGVSQLLSVPYALYANSAGIVDSTIWKKNLNNIFYNDGNVGIGEITPTGKLVVKSDSTAMVDDVIFSVLNAEGDTVLAVYQEGVRIWVSDDTSGTKATSSRGGFAVGGFTPAKGMTNEYLRVTPDSVRVYIDDDYNGSKASGTRGGFAVGGFSPSKGTITDDYLFVQDDSTRVYITGSEGFAVDNIEAGNEGRYMDITPQNYFIGHNSGQEVTTGLYNCTYGYKADSALLDGNSNIVIGHEAGINNHGGSENVFMGYQSGYSNSVGGQNVFIGYQSGYSYTGQFGAVCIGTNAGRNTMGPDNVMIGRHTGMNSTGGSNNVMVGSFAGSSFTGGNSVMVGTGTGAGSGGWNTFLGCNVADNNTTGAYNLFAGWRCGDANTTGANNVYLGHKAGYSNSTGSGCIFIGNEAGYNETLSDKLYIDNFNTTAPLIYGDFASDYLTINGNLMAAGTYFRIVGNPGTGATPTNYAYQGITGSSSQQYAFTIYDALWVTGEAWFDDDITCVALTQTSDKRYKKDIESIEEPLDKIKNLNGVYYYWKKDKYPNMGYDSERQIGFVAQDVKKITPELVKEDSKGYMSVNYSKISALLVEGIKEQQKQIDKQNKEIELLKTQLKDYESLEHRVKELELTLEVKARK